MKCSACENNRLHKHKVKEEAIEQQTKEIVYEGNRGTSQLENLYEEISNMTVEDYNALLEKVENEIT